MGAGNIGHDLAEQIDGCFAVHQTRVTKAVLARRIEANHRAARTEVGAQRNDTIRGDSYQRDPQTRHRGWFFNALSFVVSCHRVG